MFSDECGDINVPAMPHLAQSCVMASVTADVPASPLGDENQQHPLPRLSRVITASATAKTANYTEDRYREVVFECRRINDERMPEMTKKTRTTIAATTKAAPKNTAQTTTTVAAGVATMLAATFFP